LAHAHAGAEVVIEINTRSLDVLHAAEPVRRTISECFAPAKTHEEETHRAPVLDADLAEEVEEMLSKRKPWNPSVWQ
jgi:hypothetical protein